MGSKGGRGERPQDRSGWAEEERTGEEAAHRKGREDGRRVEPSAGRGSKSQLVRLSGAGNRFLGTNWGSYFATILSQFGGWRSVGTIVLVIF